MLLYTKNGFKPESTIEEKNEFKIEKNSKS